MLCLKFSKILFHWISKSHRIFTWSVSITFFALAHTISLSPQYHSFCIAPTVLSVLTIFLLCHPIMSLILVLFLFVFLILRNTFPPDILHIPLIFSLLINFLTFSRFLFSVLVLVRPQSLPSFFLQASLFHPFPRLFTCNFISRYKIPTME